MIRLDHLVYAVPDLAAGVAAIERAWGVRPSPGGRHAAWGTRNALLAIGDRAFLEIIGPDPDAGAPASGPRPFGIDALTRGRLVTWCAATDAIEADVARAAAAGADLGPIGEGRRVRDDGVELRWRLTDLAAPRMDGVLPFLIDWGTTPHPAATAAAGARLLEWRLAHPAAAEARRVLNALGAGAEVRSAPAPAMIATFETPRGRVEVG